MAKYDLIVFTNSKPGQEAEYHSWYDGAHMPELLALDAFTGGERYDVSAGLDGAPPKYKYMAIYHIEADDPETAVKQVHEAGKAGKLTPSDAVDRSETFSVVVARR